MSDSKLQNYDRVTVKSPVSAFYSGYNDLYPIQNLTPGMVGTVVSISSPAVRGSSDILIEFEGAVHGTIAHPYIFWRCRTNRANVIKLTTT